jgi:hypothetical protein
MCCNSADDSAGIQLLLPTPVHVGQHRARQQMVKPKEATLLEEFGAAKRARLVTLRSMWFHCAAASETWDPAQ